MVTDSGKDTLPAQSAENIYAARKQAGLTQQEAAELVYRADSARWREWESGRHQMDTAVWELFLLKTGQRKIATRQRKKGSALG